jgi:hypothetical protein
MKLRLTNHARDRMKARGITSGDIRAVLKNPKIEIQQLARQSTKAWKAVGGRRVTVVYAKTAINEATIITVY